MDEEGNLFGKNIRDLIGEEVNAAIEVVNYGSVACNDKNEKYGYYIVELATSVPWTDQETHEFLCDAVYWNSVPARALGWCTRSYPPHIETHF